MTDFDTEAFRRLLGTYRAEKGIKTLSSILGVSTKTLTRFLRGDGIAPATLTSLWRAYTAATIKGKL